MAVLLTVCLKVLRLFDRYLLSFTLGDAKAGVFQVLACVASCCGAVVEAGQRQTAARKRFPHLDALGTAPASPITLKKAGGLSTTGLKARAQRESRGEEERGPKPFAAIQDEEFSRSAGLIP